ncbi:MAG TPA: DEAD/DEAH box helicase family protein [Candidatus Saccharimonadales bacterium]
MCLNSATIEQITKTVKYYALLTETGVMRYGKTLLMGETLGSSETDRLDWGLAQRVLGIDSFTDPGTPLDIYDERRQIVRDIQAAENAMRGRMVSAAQAQGIVLGEQEVRDWRATKPGEIAQLRAEMSWQRRVARMIAGLVDLQGQAQDPAVHGVPLRKHQHSFTADFCKWAIHATRNEGDNGKSGAVEGPPGIGKTAIFAKVTARLKYHDERGDESRVVVVVPTELIRDQTLGEMGQRGFGKFAPDMDVGVYPRQKDSLDREVTLMCQPSFNRLFERGELDDRHIGVIDEVDTALGPQIRENLMEFRRNRQLIGLSATTERGGRNIYDELINHNISRLSTRDAIRAGLLAPSIGHLVEVTPSVDPATLPTDPALRRKALRRAYLEAYMEAAKPRIRAAVERGDLVMVRVPPGEDVKHAHDYADELRDIVVRGDAGILGSIDWVNAAFIGGTTKRQSKEDRRVIIEGFDDGSVQVLVQVKAAGRGFDNPLVKEVHNLDPTSSSSENIQWNGRATRLIFDKDKKPVVAHMYDYVDPELGNLQQTCLDMLGTKSGELVDHDPVESEVPRPRYHKGFVPRPDVIDVTSDIIETIAVEHVVAPELPDEEELAATAAVYKGPGKVPQAEACRILGIRRPTLKNILSSVGLHPDDDVAMEDISTILELYPGMNAEPLPEDVPMVKATDAAHRVAKFYVRANTLIAFARTNGYRPGRYRGADGINFYWTEEEAEEIIKLYQESKGIKREK